MDKCNLTTMTIRVANKETTFIVNKVDGQIINELINKGIAGNL